MINIKELKQCPYCGNDDKYYRKETYKGYCEFAERFDGKEAENGDMYESAISKLKSKFAYCSQCNRKIAELESEE